MVTICEFSYDNKQAKVLRNSNLQRGVAALTKTGKEENDNYCFRVSTDECSTYRKKNYLLLPLRVRPSVRPYVWYMFCPLKSFQTRTFFFFFSHHICTKGCNTVNFFHKITGCSN